MAIEFNCPSCGKLLKTKDDKAGLTAKCPDCGSPVTVPLLNRAVRENELDEPEVVDDTDPWNDPRPKRMSSAGRPPEDEVDEVEEGVDEVQADEPDIGAPMKTCPMCGKQIRATAKICRFCGESFSGPRADSNVVRPTPVAAGDVINAAWSQFKKEGVMIVVSFLVVWGVLVAVAVGMYIFGAGAAFALFAGMAGVGGGGGGGGPPPAMAAGMVIGLIVLVVFFVLLFMVAQVFLTLGQWIFLLNVAKGRDPDLGNLFSGGPFLLRGIGAALLMLLVTGALMAVTLGPVAALGVALGPNNNQDILAIVNLAANGVYYLGAAYMNMRLLPHLLYLVDQDCGPIECFQGSLSITAPNQVTQLVLVPVMAVAMSMLGVAACCIGILVTMPFYMHLQAVGYLMMCGRSVRTPD